MFPRLIVLAAAMSCSLHLRPQSFGSHSIALTPTVEPNYVIDEAAYKSKLQLRLKGCGDKRLIRDYARQSFEDQQQLFGSGQVYYNWPEAADFVKKVLLKAVPPGFATGEIKIFILRSPDFNAFCLEDGNILVTAGFLAAMSNEAELAATLSHEYGHYYLNHNFSAFKLKHASNNTGRGVLVSSRSGAGYFRKLRDAERDADTFALRFLEQSHYSTNAIAGHFKRYEAAEKQQQALHGYSRVPRSKASHPGNRERLKRAQRFIHKHPDNGELFLEDSVQFADIRKRAADECVYLYHEALRFDECLELAFLQHLLHPRDEFYLYYIVSCLRGRSAAEPAYSQKAFITGNYRLSGLRRSAHWTKAVTLAIKPGDKRFKYSIFNHLDCISHRLNDEEAKKLQVIVSLRIENIPYFTNAEALEHFTSLLTPNAVFSIFRTDAGELDQDRQPPAGLEAELIKTNRSLQIYDQVREDCDNNMLIIHQLRQYEYDGRSLRRFHDAHWQKKFFDSYERFTEKMSFDKLMSEGALNFRESSKVKHIAEYLHGLFAQGPQTTIALDFSVLCPELTVRALSDKLQGFYFVELNLYPLAHSEAEVFVVDLRNKCVRKEKIVLPCSYYTPADTLLKNLFTACEKLVGNRL